MEGVERQEKLFLGYFYRETAPQIGIVKEIRELARAAREFFRVDESSFNVTRKNSAERLNAALTRLVVAFTPIESKRCTLTSGIAQKTILYASVQIVPFGQSSRSRRKATVLFPFLFLLRSARGPSPLFETTPLVASDFDNTAQFARGEFS